MTDWRHVGLAEVAAADAHEMRLDGALAVNPK